MSDVFDEGGVCKWGIYFLVFDPRDITSFQGYESDGSYILILQTTFG